jgi:Fe-S oxidoreductase
MPHHHDDAECSGGGAGLPRTMPTAAARIAERRLEDARETGADVVVTACAACKRQLRRAGGGPEVRDLFALAGSLVE